uniref:Uncharacterized protein n=1 Tax=Balaenoptera musculus TaxID=9771 RepID=A0A8C0HTW3_BALMU
LTPEAALPEGGRKLEAGASLGLFRLNTVEARDRSSGPPGRTAKSINFLTQVPSSGNPKHLSVVLHQFDHFLWY